MKIKLAGCTLTAGVKLLSRCIHNYNEQHIPLALIKGTIRRSVGQCFKSPSMHDDCAMHTLN